MAEQPVRGRPTLRNPRRYIAFLVILAMTSLAVRAPAPAFAATPPVSATRTGSGHAPAAVTPNVPRPGDICLTNSNSHCLGIDQPTAEVIVAAIAAAVRILEIFVGRDNDN